MEKYVAKCENQNFVSKLSLWSLLCFLKFGFMSSLSIIFCILKLLRIAKIELKMQLPSVSKKETPEFCRYGKFALYKFFFYKLCTKRTEPIFDPVKIQAVYFSFLLDTNFYFMCNFLGIFIKNGCFGPYLLNIYVYTEVRPYLSESTGHFVSYETQLDYI